MCTLCQRARSPPKGSCKTCSKENCLTLTHSFPNLFRPGTLFSLQDTCYNAVKYRLGKCSPSGKHKTLHPSLSQSLWMHFWMERYVCLSLDLIFFVTPAMKFQRVVPERRKDWGGLGECGCILPSFSGLRHICPLSSPEGVSAILNKFAHWALLSPTCSSSGLALCPPTRTIGTCSGVLANQLSEGKKKKQKQTNPQMPWLVVSAEYSHHG